LLKRLERPEKKQFSIFARKKMRFLILFFSIALFACSGSHKNFEINGTVNGAKGKVIYLSSSNSVDSAIIDSEDRFTFAGWVNHANYFNLYFDKTNPILLYVDSGSVITIETAFEQFSTLYKVSGSAVSSDICLLQMRLNKTFARVKQIQAENLQQADSNTIDSIKNIITSQINKEVEEHRNFIFQYIRQNPSSFAVLPAIYQAFDSRNPIFSFVNDYEYYTIIDSALMAAHPKSLHAQDFHSQYLQMKRQYEPYLQPKNNPSQSQQAPDFTVNTPTGGKISLSSLKGKWVLLDFWAAWCGPCRHESPFLVDAYNLFHKKNFTIFQVSLDQNKEDWTAAIAKDNLSKWQHGSDLKYWNSEPAQMYGVNSIPANFLINPQGVIVAQNLRGPALTEKLKEVLK
jgi:peroxiredoxin